MALPAYIITPNSPAGDVADTKATNTFTQAQTFSSGIITNSITTVTPNDLTITCGANKTPVLANSVWKDVFFPQGSPKTTGVGSPTRVNWIGGLYGYSYAINDSYDPDQQEFPHDGKQAVATASWHIHWVSRTNVAAARYVKWQIEYTMAGINGVFPATTTISAEETIPANTTANTHFLTSLGTFTTPNIGSHFCLRVTRIAASGTAPADDPVVLGTHFHYEVDTLGSRQIATK